MKKRTQKVIPKPVVELEGRIENWRKTREKRGPMPQALWDEATQLADKYGIWEIARIMRLSYGTLKYRVTNKAKSRSSLSSNDFVDVTAIANSNVINSGFEIEMLREDGNRVVIKNASADCVSGVASVFFN